MEYFDTLSSAPMQDADTFEGRSDAAFGRQLRGRGKNLQVLAAGQVTVEAGLVDDGPDPGQRPVAMAGNGVAQELHRPGVSVVSPSRTRIRVVFPAPLGPR
jgi:hypothetical protein